MTRRTIQDVARVAGVTHPTVSRALAGHPDVAPETVRRVREAAAAVGYRPNLFARALKRGQSPLVGVLANSVTSPFNAQLIGRFEALARTTGLVCLLCDTTASEDPYSDPLDLLLDLPLRGMVLVGERTVDTRTQDRLVLAARNGLRIVALSATVDTPEIPNVGVDQEQVGLIATRHLIESGHHRIAYVRPGPNRQPRYSQAAIRQRGYEAALADAGNAVGPAIVYYLDDPTKDAALELMDRVRADTDPPTALLVYNDMRALAILGAALDRGIRVPDQLALIGVDNLAFGALVSPSLTSVEQPIDELVGAGLAVLQSSDLETAGRLIEPRLIVRGSTARLI